MKHTPQDIVDWIYAMLEAVDYLLDKRGCSYCAMDGTLLGAERHGGLIPWDDDADLFMLKPEADSLLHNPEDFAQLGLGVAAWWYGYKVFPLAIAPQPNAAGVPVPYPSIDLVTVEPQADRLILTSARARALWPNEYLTAPEWQRRTRRRFGDITLTMPSAADTPPILDRLYDADWGTVAYQIWDHTTDTAAATNRIPLPSIKPARRQHRLIDLPRDCSAK